MCRTYRFSICFILLLLLKINVFSAVPVAVIPFEGENSNSVENKVKEILSKTGGIAVVADKLMDEIMKVHEEAQVVGSSNLDASKIKVAEFIITGTVSSGKLNLKAVDVNLGTEVYNQTIDISGDNSKYKLVKSIKEMSDKVLFQSSSKNSDIPYEAKPYMDIISKLVASLSGSDESSYPFMAIYLKGKYNHPDLENNKSAESAKRQLKFMRQDFLRSKLYFINIKNESFWIYIDVVAEKSGRKIKYRFGLLELDDGSIAVANYEMTK